MSNVREELKNLRRDFDFSDLDKNDMLSNPIEMLKNWLDNAISNEIIDANAFVLSTSVNNEPDSRVLLLRDINENGIHFYTNYNSKKGQDLKANPKATVNIFWPQLERQIRIHVEAEVLAPSLSDEYFASRPRGSQIGAWASDQSDLLKDRKILDKRIKEIEQQFEGKEVTRPNFWGGYLLKPNYFEFWQGRKSRLHDRITYKKEGDNWVIERLYP